MRKTGLLVPTLIFCVGLCCTLAGPAREAPSTAAEGGLEEVTLVWYALGDKPTDFDEVFAQLNEKTMAKIKCKVETKFISWSDFDTKYGLVFASGEKFDMIYTSEWSFFADQAVKNGFAELTPDLLRKYAPNIWANQPAESWDQARIHGKIYMIPQSRIEYSCVAAIVRGDLREKYGLPKVDSLATYEAYLDALAKNEKGMIPYNAASGDGWLAQAFFDQHYGYRPVEGGYVFALRDLKAEPKKALDLPEYAAFLKKMRTFNERGYWSRNVLNNKVSSDDSFLNGTSAASMHNIFQMMSVWRQATDAHPEWKPEVCDLTEDSPIYTHNFIVDGMAVHAGSDNIERDLMWMDMIRSDQDCYDLMMYGIEGRHWKNEGPGLMSPGPNQDGFGMFSNWGFVTEGLLREDVGEWPGKDALFEKLRSRVVVNPVIHMPFDDTAVRNEGAALSNISTKYWGVLIYGFAEDPIATAREQEEQLKAAGLDKIIAEWVSQRDTYLKELASAK